MDPRSEPEGRYVIYAVCNAEGVPMTSLSYLSKLTAEKVASNMQRRMGIAFHVREFIESD